MAVQGEYSRALEALLALLRGIEQGAKEGKWTTAFEAARIGRHSDLSSAARLCLQSLESIDAEATRPSPGKFEAIGDPLSEPLRQLKAHCRAILGSLDETGEPKPRINN